MILIPFLGTMPEHNIIVIILYVFILKCKAVASPHPINTPDHTNARTAVLTAAFTNVLTNVNTMI